MATGGWADDDIFNSDDAFAIEDSDEEDEDYHDPGSDDDQNCPICLNDFEEQQIALPSNCQHAFCVDCILEWSKKSNSCPVDRLKFQGLRVYHRFAGLFNREVLIKDSAYLSDDAYEIETVCEICNLGDREETLLLCDGCDLGFHCGCLTPVLTEIPAGEWFCDRCKRERRDTTSVAQPRLVGRTNLSERVRSRVSQTRRRHAENYSTLDDQLDAIVDEILKNAATRFRAASPSSSRRRTLAKKPIKRRRKRRKGRRGRSRSSKRTAGSDVKPTSFSKEDVRNMQKFSLTGKANDLNELSARRCAVPEIPSHVIAKRHRLLSQSALQFNQPLPSLFSLHAEASANLPPMSPPPPLPDMLSSIIASQDLLFTPSSKLTIQRGGNIVRKKEKPKEKRMVPQPTTAPHFSPPSASRFPPSTAPRPLPLTAPHPLPSTAPRFPPSTTPCFSQSVTTRPPPSTALRFPPSTASCFLPSTVSHPPPSTAPRFLPSTFSIPVSAALRFPPSTAPPLPPPNTSRLPQSVASRFSPQTAPSFLRSTAPHPPPSTAPGPPPSAAFRFTPRNAPPSTAPRPPPSTTSGPSPSAASRFPPRNAPLFPSSIASRPQPSTAPGHMPSTASRFQPQNALGPPQSVSLRFPPQNAPPLSTAPGPLPSTASRFPPQTAPPSTAPRPPTSTAPGPPPSAASRFPPRNAPPSTAPCPPPSTAPGPPPSAASRFPPRNAPLFPSSTVSRPPPSTAPCPPSSVASFPPSSAPCSSSQTNPPFPMQTAPFFLPPATAPSFPPPRIGVPEVAATKLEVDQSPKQSLAPKETKEEMKPEKEETKAKEILPVPAPDIILKAPPVSTESTTITKSSLTRTSVSSNTSKPSIMIKPIFSLPNARKSLDDDTYDPFRPLDSDDNMDMSDEEGSDKEQTKESKSSPTVAQDAKESHNNEVFVKRDFAKIDFAKNKDKNEKEETKLKNIDLETEMPQTEAKQQDTESAEESDAEPKEIDDLEKRKKSEDKNGKDDNTELVVPSKDNETEQKEKDEKVDIDEQKKKIEKLNIDGEGLETKTKSKELTIETKDTDKEINEEDDLKLEAEDKDAKMEVELDSQIENKQEEVTSPQVTLLKNVENEKTEVKVDEQAENKNEEVKSPQLDLTKNVETTSLHEDDFEIDIFLEEELEKAQAEAARKAEEMPDPLKLWRDEVRQATLAETPSQVVLPAFDPNSALSSAPMKFKKINRKEQEEDGKSRYRSRKGSAKNDHEVDKIKTVKKRTKEKSPKKIKKSKEDKKKKRKELRRKEEAMIDPPKRHRRSGSDRQKSPVTRRPLSPITVQIHQEVMLPRLPPTHRSRRSDSDMNSSLNNSFSRAKSPEISAKKKRRITDHDHSFSKDQRRKRQEDEGRDNQKEKARVREEKKEKMQKRDARKEKNTDNSTTKKDAFIGSHKMDEKLLKSVKNISDHHSKVLDDSKFFRKREIYVKGKRRNISESKLERGRSSSGDSYEMQEKSKKKKKKSSRRRSRSKSRSIEKSKKKKKKRSRSPKKKKAGKQQEEPVGLSFDHIFAEFDSMKKNKREKARKRKRSIEKRSTDYEEEEISVVYEYESLSEGEIISSDDEYDRRKNSMKPVSNSSFHREQLTSKTRSTSPIMPYLEKSPAPVAKVSSVVVKVANKIKPIVFASEDQPLIEESVVSDVVQSKSPSHGKSKLAPDQNNQIDVSLSPVDIKYEDTETLVQEEELLEEEKSSPAENFESTKESTSQAESNVESDLPTISPEKQVKEIEKPSLIAELNVQRNEMALSPAISIEASIIEEESEYISSAPGISPDNRTPNKDSSMVQGIYSDLPLQADLSTEKYWKLANYLKSIKGSKATEFQTRDSPLATDSLTNNQSAVDDRTDQNVDSHLALKDAASPVQRLSNIRSPDIDAEPVMLPTEEPITPPSFLKSSFYKFSSLKKSSISTTKSVDEEKEESDQQSFSKSVTEIATKPVTDPLHSRNDISIQRMTARVSPITVKSKHDSGINYSPLRPHTPLYEHPAADDTRYLHQSPSRALSTRHSENRNLPYSSTLPFSSNSNSRNLPFLNDSSSRKPFSSDSSARNTSFSSNAGARNMPLSDSDARNFPFLNDAVGRNLPELSRNEDTTRKVAATSMRQAHHVSAAADTGVISSTSVQQALQILTSFSTQFISSTQPKVQAELAATLKPETSKQDLSSTSLKSYSSDRSQSKSEPSTSNPPEKRKAQKNPNFQQEVAIHAKAALLPYFKRREVSKEQYKGIMKKAVNKVCKDDKGKPVDPEKINKLIHKYVRNFLHVNEKNMKRMRNLLDRKVNKDIKKRLKDDLDFSRSPPSPIEES